MIFAILIQKGGVGKTTTAATLAQAAADKNKKVLAVDLDPQANLTYALAAKTTHAGAYELLHGGAISRSIQRSPQNIDVIAAGKGLQTERSAQGSALRLQKSLAAIRGQYDYIFIDTPSTGGELQYNALQAAEGLIIPLQADAYNLQSAYQTIETAKHFMDTNPALNLTGIIFTAYDARTNLAKTMREIIAARCKEYGAPDLGIVRKSIAIAEAAALQKSIYEYAPKSNPAQDYKKILAKLPTAVSQAMHR